MQLPFPIDLAMVPQPSPHMLVVVRAHSEGQPIEPHTIVGHAAIVSDRPEWSTFRANAPFIDALVRYMRSPAGELRRELLEARVDPGERFVLIDGRVDDPSGAVPSSEIVGLYETDPSGQPMFDTFRYNPNHVLVRADGMISSYVRDAGLHASLVPAPTT